MIDIVHANVMGYITFSVIYPPLGVNSSTPDVQDPITTTFLPAWSLVLLCCDECKIDASCLLKECNYTPGAEQRNDLNRD